MNTQQKTGGLPKGHAAAALTTAALFITSFIFILVVWPSYGVRGPEDVRDPAVILPAVAQAPILLLWLAINMPIAVVLGFVVLALKERLQGRPTSLVRFAFVVGLAAALFFFVVGVVRFIGYPYLANQYLVDPASAAAAYNSYLVVDNAFDRAAIFSSGLWLVVVSWTVLKVGGLPRLLSYFGIVTGAAGLLGAILPAFAPIALLLYIVWFLWLGISGVRNRGSVSVSYPSTVSTSSRPN